MITPSFSLTATERVLPKLALDFTTAALDPRVTFTRSGNTATVVNSFGLIQTINANLPRFDFNPVTLVCKGLLIEESRTNVTVYSEDFSSWSPTNATVSVNQITAPDGNTTADKLITDNAVSGGQVFLTPVFTYGVDNTVSVFAKAGEWGWLAVESRGTDGVGRLAAFDLTNGVTGFAGAGVTSSIQPYGNGWYRCTATRVLSAGGSTSRFRVYSSNQNPTSNAGPFSTGDGSSGIYIWGAQAEVGAFATSYIPTEASQVTRNADVATMTGTNFSDWYNQSEGALSCEFAFIGYELTNRDRIVSITDATGNEEIGIIQNSTNGYGRFEVVDGGANQALLNCINTTMTAGTTYQICGTYKVNSFCGSGSLGSQATDASGTIPTPDRMCLGGYGPGTTTAIFNGHLKSVNYWPQRITNNETLAFAKI